MIDILFYTMVIFSLFLFIVIVLQKPEISKNRSGEFEEKQGIMFFLLPALCTVLFFVLGLGNFDIEKNVCFNQITTVETIDNTTTNTNTINCETKPVIEETAPVWFDILATICIFIFIWRVFGLARKAMGGN